jgi:hypothetical protein
MNLCGCSDPEKEPGNSPRRDEERIIIGDPPDKK